MNYKVEATPHFLSQAKKLSKKYPSLKADIAALAEQLSTNPSTGTPLGNNFYNHPFIYHFKRKRQKRRSKNNYLCEGVNNYRLPGFNLR